jgi:hypothetical protein
MAEKLLPCPFCGSDAELEYESDDHGAWFNLGCSRRWPNVEPGDACCGAQIWYIAGIGGEAAAIAAWNRRAPSGGAGKTT